MNWYKLSQTMQAYLERLQIDPAVIQFILSQDPPKAQLLTNEVRKNPSLTVQELYNFNFPEKSNFDPYLRSEYAAVRVRGNSDELFQQWALVSLRKLRKGKMPHPSQSVENILTEDEKADYMTFKNQLGEIYDWYRGLNPELASYSPEQAIEATDAWHKMMAGRGEGEIYEPIKRENIVYGPKWKNEKYNGWTIQNVVSKNDLEVEGNLMNHCVGGYCGYVERGTAKIFSLRDPNNNPHVTIELDFTEKIIKQMEGNSHQIPSINYLDMIYEWIANDKNAPSRFGSGDNIEWDIEPDLDDIENKLDDLRNGYIAAEEWDYRDENTSDRYLAEYLDLDYPRSQYFEEQLENLDVPELMTKVFQGIAYRYNRLQVAPESIDWSHEDRFIDLLLKTIREFDARNAENAKNYYARTMVNILQGQTNDSVHLIPDIENLDDRDLEIVRSFSKYVLQRISVNHPEQTYFDFKSSNSWYRVITAQNMQAYLQSLGIDPVVIQFILSQPNAQLLTNEVRKNPQLQVSDLQNISMPQKRDPYLESEINFARNYAPAEMYRWVLVQLRRLRQGRLPSPGQSERDFYLQLTQSHPESIAPYQNFRSNIGEIVDWWRHSEPTPTLENFSAEQAMEASDEWHELSAQGGANLQYLPTEPSLILYGPEWKNPEWQGWTVQKVTTANDLKVEGNRMDHCVGDYCVDVEHGDSIIFSLRDPKNMPHVTIETDDSYRVVQIQGKSNFVPKKEYRAMIKEWLDSDNNPGIYEYSDASDPFDEINNAYSTPEDILDVIDRVINDDYGLKRDMGTDAVDIMNMSISMMNRNREPTFWGDWHNVPAASIDMMRYLYKNDPKTLANKISELEDAAAKQEEDINDFAFSHWDSGYTFPNPEDFETEEEYEEAVEEIQKQEDEEMAEAIRETPQGGYAGAVFDYIHELREKKIIPPHKYFHSEEKPVPQDFHGSNTHVGSKNWYKSL